MRKGRGGGRQRGKGVVVGWKGVRSGRQCGRGGSSGREG